MSRVLLTGATSGVGEALAYLLANQGCSLILSGRNEEKLRLLERELQAEEVIPCDLNERPQRERLITCIRETLPELVINNAGFAIYGDALTIPVAEQLAILRVNAEAALELTLETARALIAAGKKGTVVNISSIAGEHPCPGMSVYGASKAFLTSVSQALNSELAPKGIHVLVSCPGMVSTNFARRAAGREVKLRKESVLTPSYAARQILKQIKNQQEKRIFDWRYRLIGWLARSVVPTSVIKEMVWKAIQERQKKN